MSWDFEQTKSSWAKLRRLYSEMSPDQQIDFFFWVWGHLAMAVAIVGAFGWWGAMFLIGALLAWSTSTGRAK